MLAKTWLGTNAYNSLCNKGGGPEEAAAFGPIFQFFKKGNDLKTLLFAPHEGKLFIWNITQSITQGSTIIDKVTIKTPINKVTVNEVDKNKTERITLHTLNVLLSAIPFETPFNFIAL